VKVVSDTHQRALYFSRSRIPFNRENQRGTQYYRHLGMYAYRAEVLASITLLPPSILEETEKLEQLRWLENGYHIAVAETQWQSPAVDTPEDLQKAIEFIIRS
jgi:3-deoxy-manno-octulosonate cytidylyltransferase (CMP-KDO synthetase)